MSSEICITRQPIINNKKELFAYEFLFKGNLEYNMNTKYLIDNIINNPGIEKMKGKSFAFFKCDYDFLISEYSEKLNPEMFVMEILPTVLVDKKAVTAVKELHEKGFKIALDDFDLNKENSALISPIIPCLSFCKLEYQKLKESEIYSKLVDIFHKYKIQVISEGLETMSDFKHSNKVGSDLHQGFFFAKSEAKTTIKMKIDTMGALHVLNRISGNYLDQDLGVLEQEFKKYPDLTVNLLKYLNSAHFGMRTEITSIKHALTMLGISKLKRWLLVLAYDNNKEVSLERSPLLINAMMRASFFGDIAKKLRWSADRAEKAYLMGLISHLDALYETSFENILEQISLDPEISKALLNGEGVMGLLLNIITIIEKGDMENATEALNTLNLTQKDVNECLMAAYTSSLSIV
ncbi:MAG: HDOD domain-containing protein [Fibromonadaceae bacterium]|jgi:EAL and modified HD-GYP domain-containing signal transduction protein|nr:HDOD domain-containing protein [Fibromonadaceae bacterium]